MSAMSEVERMDNERKGILKNQIIAGMIEDSALQRALKKERHKRIDFAQQTQTQARQLEYQATVRRVGHGTLGGIRLGGGGVRTDGTELKKQQTFQGGESSALQYGKGLQRDPRTGVFKMATSTEVSNVYIDRLKEKQKWTTSGYKDVDTGALFGMTEKLEMHTPKGGGTSELRRRSRARLQDKLRAGHKFSGSGEGQSIGGYERGGFSGETVEDRRQRRIGSGIGTRERTQEDVVSLGLGFNKGLGV